MNRIAVFARWPEPGRVKTRLSPALPPALACDLHRAMLADAADLAAASAGAGAALYWSDAPPDRSGFALPRALEIRDQVGRDLGARLAHAFAELLRGEGDRAAVIGTDCPELGPRQVAAAFAALEAADLVLGPTRDGGYYLIGLGRVAPALFERVDWGTDRVLEQTRERAAGAGLVVRLIEPLEDVDTSADLVRLIARLATGDATAPHTRAALRGIGLLPGA